MKTKTAKQEKVAKSEKCISTKKMKKQQSGKKKKLLTKGKNSFESKKAVKETTKRTKKSVVVFSDAEKPIESEKKHIKRKSKASKEEESESSMDKPKMAQVKRHKQMHKKKHYNKEAIEKMKARQQAKKEKALQQTPPTPKTDAKRRRPKLPVRLEKVDLTFAEDDVMTEFEGVWVPREETGRLQAAREDLERRGLAADELERRMKRLLRREHRRLKLRLIGALAKTERAARERAQFLSAQRQPRVRRRLPGRACGLRLEEGEQLGRFDGFWVGAEAVARLETLRARLAVDGRPEDEARRLLRKARRAEERRAKSAGRLLCCRCGGRGHVGSDCAAPARQAAAGTACFRCGDAGHRLADCPSRDQIAGLPFATCFLCQQRGHMSRDCPQGAEEAAPQKRGRAPPAASAAGDQSWRGLTHDAGDVEVVVKKAAPVKEKRKSKAKGHIRFDFG